MWSGHSVTGCLKAARSRSDRTTPENTMSRAYRITVKESETRHLKAGDEICTDLEILEILPPEDMATLLREELKRRGFNEQDDGTFVRKDGDLTVKVDPCSGEVSVKAETA